MDCVDLCSEISEFYVFVVRFSFREKEMDCVDLCSEISEFYVGTGPSMSWCS